MLHYTLVSEYTCIRIMWKNGSASNYLEKYIFTFLFGIFLQPSSCPGLRVREMNNQRHLYGEHYWPLKGLGQFRPACCIFSPSLSSLSLPVCPVCLRREGLGNSFKLLCFSYWWDLNMHTEALVQFMLVSLLLILLCTVEDTVLQSVRWVST